MNVLIHRLPRGQSLVSPPSTCPACGVRIRPWDNVPVLSYLLLRGKARCCGAPISPRYPLVELLGGLLSAAVLTVIVSGLPAEASLIEGLLVYLAYLALGLLLIALSFIDLEHMLLPDSLTLGGALLGLVTATLRESSFLDSALGAAAGFLMIWLPFDVVYRRIRGHPGMGLGDAKLTLLAGAWLGWQGAVFALFAGAVQATVITLCVYLVHGKIEEPEEVVREREAMHQRLALATGDDRALLEREMELDPVMRPPEAGLAKARTPFGPFLALATLEYVFLHPLGLLDGLGVWSW